MMEKIVEEGRKEDKKDRRKKLFWYVFKTYVYPIIVALITVLLTVALMR